MYASIVNSALLASGFAIHTVNAGSWAWQPKVNTSFASIETTESLSGTVNGIKTGTELHSLNKRYSYTVNTDAKPWPGCTIRYCFADDDTEQALFDNLKDAIERWYRSGLDRNSFKWEKVSRDECTQKRSTHLVISITQVKSHDTTVGYEPAGPGFPGPSMNLYDGDLKSLDKVASFSHEVGHAWGLRHEHQVPQYWKTGEGYADAVGGDSAVFGNGNFHCENLADYEEKTAFVRDTMGQPPNIVKQLCTKYSIARQYKFSAVNWLPDTAGIVATDSDQGVDWDSIMLYPGFVGSGDPNVQILTKPDGSSITQNINPSERDVRGLNKFCENAGPPPPPLLVAKSNPKRSRFRDLFKKDNGPKGGC